ncbi:hypothetical protein [Hydrogenophaga sp. OTU3427]|uniref:hypothetical protein n=1 Tax=Hydrogenophaga sp. OTU3427 TaxID=3043856 RepID=UPI00313D56CC
MKTFQAGAIITSMALLLLQACGGGKQPVTAAPSIPVWNGGSASLQLQVFASHAAGVLSDPPLAYFSYHVVPTPNVAIENWLPMLTALPSERARCVPEGPVHVLTVDQGNERRHYVDEDHAACVLTDVPAGAQAIATQDMQTLQGLLLSYEQDQAQRVADAQARIQACHATVPTFNQGVHGCLFTATDVVMPYLVNEDVRPQVSVAVFAASAPLDSPAQPWARTTSDAVGHYELALAAGHYLLCTGEMQPSTGSCESIAIDTGQVLRRNYKPGDPPSTLP